MKRIGLLLDKDMKETVLGYCQIFDRILLVKLKRKPFNISIIFVSALTAQRKKLIGFTAHWTMQEITIIMGNLNAKVGKEHSREIVDRFELGTHNECR